MIVTIKSNDEKCSKSIKINYSNSNNWNESDFNYVKDIVKDVNFNITIFNEEGNKWTDRNEFDWLKYITLLKGEIDSSVSINMEKTEDANASFDVTYTTHKIYVFKNDVLYYIIQSNLQNQNAESLRVIGEFANDEVAILFTGTSVKIENTVFEKLQKATNAVLYFLSYEYMWTLKSEEITNTNVDFNTGLLISNEKPDNIKTDEITEGIFLNFTNDGELPGKAIIDIDIGTEKFGENTKILSLYYYNETANKYEYVQDVNYNEGEIKLSLTRGSRYVLTENTKNNLEDIDGNGKITATDLLLLKRHLVAGGKQEWILIEDRKAGDINKDGKITATDLILMKRLVLSKIATY